jgi:beta-lactamase regulating signal transducer with metallopeptidase domain
MRDLLTRAVLDGALFAAAVWILVRLVPRLGPTARTALWWIVAAKFIVGVVWIAPVDLPLLPAPLPAPVDTSMAMGDAGAASGSSTAAAAAPFGWALVLMVLWVAGAIVSLALAARRWTERCRAVRDAKPAGETIQATAAAIAALLRMRRVPRVRVSESGDSPFTTGIRHAVVVVPARFSMLPGDEQRMALCHELAHVKRGDLWLGIVPALAERIFFFHPLARLAAREYVFWREVACDAAVLSALGTAPQAYGRLLLDLGIASRPAALAPAGAAWSFATLKRRIVMLQRPSKPSARGRIVALVVCAAAIIGLAPFRIVARSPDAMTPAMRPAAREAQATAPAPRETDVPFVFMHGNNTTMSGSSEDVERARRLRSGGEDLLWFRLDGREYLVGDAAVLAEVRQIWQAVSGVGAEQSLIGARQSEIGARQSEIGARQSSIGVEQSAIGAKQSNIGARQAALGARQQQNLSAAERADIERQMRGFDDDMRALDRQMAELEKKMRQLDEPMSDLSEDMNKLGREMDVLGKKMEEAQRKAGRDMRALVERAVRSGAARPVR